MLSPSYGVGGLGFSANAVSTSRGRLVVPAGDTEASLFLLTEGITRLRVWANQTAPAGAGQGVALTLEFMVRAINPVKNGDDWLPLLPPIVLIPGIPNIVFDTEFSATKIRLSADGFGNPGDPDTVIDYILSGGG